MWNVNRTSMILFAKIAFMRINIQGFVTPQKEYVGETYMNRPIVAVAQIEKEKDSIILVSDEVPKEKINVLPKDQVVYWFDAVEFNEALITEQIIIYGTGYGAGQIEDLLDERQAEVKLYCVTARKGCAIHKGKKLIEASELDFYSGYAVVVSVKAEKYRKEILETLADFSGHVYVDSVIDEVAFFHLNLFQNIDLAIKLHKKIYLYGKKNNLGKMIQDILCVYNIKIEGYVNGKSENNDVNSIYAVALDGINDKLVILCEILPDKLIVARRNVELAGFSLEGHNYVGFEWYTTSDDNMSGKLLQNFDALVGMTVIYPQGKPGWKQYGKESKGSIRIIVLGGSTSSEIYYPENWVSKFYYKLKQQNISATIYNGAHAADDIVDEMLRLLRDINVLKPHIVISMSGVNNLAYKESCNQFNETRMLCWAKSFSGGKKYCTGIEDRESLFSFWDRNHKLLKEISNFYGADFLGFLQPMNIAMEHMDLREKSLYELEHCLEGAMDFKLSACQKEHYVNLLRIFEHKDNMFIDAVHYTDDAQEIIANKVYEAVIPLIWTL